MCVKLLGVRLLFCRSCTGFVQHSTIQYLHLIHLHPLSLPTSVAVSLSHTFMDRHTHTISTVTALMCCTYVSLIWVYMYMYTVPWTSCWFVSSLSLRGSLSVFWFLWVLGFVFFLRCLDFLWILSLSFWSYITVYITPSKRVCVTEE